MKKITAQNPFNWIEDIFKDFTPVEKRSFDYLCLVSGRVDSPGPRSPRWEYILDSGMPLIERVLKRQAIGKGPHFFIFPDRWMVPGEAVEFESALYANPDAHLFRRVYVVCFQPYLIAGCLKEQVRILREDKP